MTGFASLIGFGPLPLRQITQPQRSLGRVAHVKRFEDLFPAVTLPRGSVPSARVAASLTDGHLDPAKPLSPC